MPLLRGSTIGIYAAKGIQETVSLAVWPITGAQQHSCFSPFTLHLLAYGHMVRLVKG